MDLMVLRDEHVIVDDDDVDDESYDVELGGLIRRKKPMKMKDDDKLYVAVGKNFRENESLLLWAIQNSAAFSISIIHVHLPDEFIPILGKKCHWSSLEETQVRKYRRIEEQLMLKTLDEYLQTCRQFGVEAEKLYIEMNSVEHGILQLINRHNIEKLVMGAASDDSYHLKMTEPKSKKAVYLLQNAPNSCHIWFICKGNLVHQREGRSHMNTNAENERPSNLTSPSLMGSSNQSEGSGQELVLREVVSHFGTSNGNGASSHMSRESTSDFVERETGPYAELNHRKFYSPPSVSQAEPLQNLYVDESRKRKLLEKELKNVISDRDRLMEELWIARDQIRELEGKVANFDLVVKDLEGGINTNMELLQISEDERNALKSERDSVLRTAEELFNQSADAANETAEPKFFTTLTFSDIEDATDHFNPAQQLWEVEHGCAYKGVLSCTQVTVKIWRSEGMHGPEDFRQEVEILSKFRHPNVVTVMGICLDACALALVYEYLPNGSLEERLRHSDNTPPLPWKTRIKIATELCSALVFLHSLAPLRVVHGTLSPASIFLDANFTCKLTDFGFSHLIPHHVIPQHTETSLLPSTSLSSGYMDPEFLTTGVVTPSMDVYSFGMILLELLIGDPAFVLMDDIEDALNENSFSSLLDTSAGDWPFVQVEQLARLALKCCSESVNDRPDLELEVWRALDAMRGLCGGSNSQHPRDEDHLQAPSYFICPINQEVMEAPHIAADGYTYEETSLRAWLDSGHDTSPMTNLQLEHCNLVPNRALRSAIQEWRQQR